MVCNESEDIVVIIHCEGKMLQEGERAHSRRPEVYPLGDKPREEVSICCTRLRVVGPHIHSGGRVYDDHDARDMPRKLQDKA